MFGKEYFIRIKKWREFHEEQSFDMMNKKYQYNLIDKLEQELEKIRRHKLEQFQSLKKDKDKEWNTIEEGMLGYVEKNEVNKNVTNIWIPKEKYQYQNG